MANGNGNGNGKPLKKVRIDDLLTIQPITDNQKIIKLLANGNVEFLKDKQFATGDKAIYHLDQDKVVITGNVKLERDNNIVKGEKLIIDFLTGLSKIEGSRSNQKVKMKYSTE